MKDFIPSSDFVARTMAKINDAVQADKKPVSGKRYLLLGKFAHYCAMACGMAFGLLNLARLYLTVFAPIACH